MNRIILCLLSIVFLFSCGKPDFTAYQSFDSGCWQIDDTLSCSYRNEEAGKQLSAEIQLVFMPDYGYRNLYLKWWVEGPSGILADTLLNEIFVDEFGAWQPARKGALYPYTFKAKPGVHFPDTGLYHIRLLQYMRDDTLCGIRSVGMEFPVQAD
jgi:gliding motility-associated lipoprotein GldH